MATTFDNVQACKLNENGEKTCLSETPIVVTLSSENYNVCVSLLSGTSAIQKILLKEKGEMAKVGEQGVLITEDDVSFLLKFASPKDSVAFMYHLKDMLTNRKDSIFNERTDAASAEQYFQFYGYLSQQQNMMQDYIRTSTYQRAMLDNTVDFMDKVVLDVGAGSGILSFFAAQAGAKKVYAIEASSMAIHCEALVAHNKLQEKIKVIAGKIEEVELPEKVDIIISEPMGYMLFNERMLETYLHAKKWLKPGGKMFPTQGDLHIAPFTDDALYMEQFSKANFWYQPSFHGVDLSNLREAAVKEYFKQPVVDTFDVRICLARSQKYVVDFQKAHETDLHNMDIPVSFMMLQTGTIHGLAFWFDVAFIGSQSTVWLSTAPTQPLTHWYQVRCLLQEPVFVKQGQTLTGRVVLKANKRQSYDVDIELNIPGTSTKVTNNLDLKNPFFRYTGQQPAPPPGTNDTSPSDAYWAQDATVAAVQQVQAFNVPVGTILNGGMGDATVVLQQQQQQSQQQQQQHQGNAAAPVNPGSIPAATVIGVNNAAHQAIQTRTSVGAGISPSLFNTTTQSHFSVSQQFMIGDYAIPSNQISLPSQGLIVQQNYKTGSM